MSQFNPGNVLILPSLTPPTGYLVPSVSAWTADEYPSAPCNAGPCDCLVLASDGWWRLAASTPDCANDTVLIRDPVTGQGSFVPFGVFCDRLGQGIDADGNPLVIGVPEWADPEQPPIVPVGAAVVCDFPISVTLQPICPPGQTWTPNNIFPVFGSCVGGATCAKPPPCGPGEILNANGCCVDPPHPHILPRQFV